MNRLLKKLLDASATATGGFSTVKIMLIIVTAAAALLAITLNLPKDTRESDQANAIAKEVLDGLQRLGGCPPASDSDSACAAFLRKYQNRPVAAGAVQYTANWEYPSAANPAAGAGFKTVDVVVAWNKGGKDRAVTLTGVLP